MKTMERIYLVGLGVLLALVTLLVLLGLAAILAPPEQPAMTVQSQAATRFTDLTIDNDLTVGGEVDAGRWTVSGMAFTYTAPLTITSVVTDVRLLIYQEE
jgi:hypothetical protein